MASSKKDDEVEPVRHSEEVLETPEDDGSSDDGITHSRSAGSETISQRRPAYHRAASTTVLDPSDRDEIVRIATVLSRRHSVATEPQGGLSRVHTLVTYDEDSPVLDPQSDQFDLDKWLRNFVKTLREQGITAKQTGVAWKDLNVSGTGEAVRVQETVGSSLLAPLRLGEWFSFGKTEHKQILRNFDGLVRSGELLICLGRPGSGCSTLLKSLCGELHGLSLDGDSTIHYDGIPQKLMKKEFKGEAIYNQEVRIPSATHTTIC